MSELGSGAVSWVELEPVVSDRIPRLYAFYQREPLEEADAPDQRADADDPAGRIRAWVLELPDGRVAVLDLGDGHRSLGVWSSIRSAATRYGEVIDCDLVPLAEPPHTAPANP
ncbi:MAG TPA: hypothetical protein VFX70_07845 [Mycobacteriales bacterium]|nr:hypothetical protein [Mycobacteriales bacterium]